MKIGFDARLMSVPGGIGRYCRELLLEISEQNPEVTYIVLVKKIPENFPPRENISWIETHIHWYTFAEQFTLGRLMNRRFDIDLWHIPHWNVPYTLSNAFIMTVHDFIFEEYPTHDGSILGKFFFILKWSVWRTLLIFNLKRAKKVITVSQFVRDELIRRFPWCAHKTTVIHVGVSEGLLHEPVHAGPPAPYFLVVGNSYPHKNHGLLFKAYESDPQLVTPTYIATHRDRFSEAAQEHVKKSGLSDRIHFVFDASDTELANLYRGCSALVFPSLSEGFGIPPLEAFLFGKPVIAAKISCMPEILGNLPDWVDPYSPRDLAELMKTLPHRLAYDESTRIVARQTHASQFSWKAAALSTQNLYKKVL